MLKLSVEHIKEIADYLDTGMKCFYNKKTQEIKMLPDFENNPYADDELWQDDIIEIDENFDDFLVFSPMESRESFNVMEAFANEVDNEEFSSRLIWALSRKHPFRNFKDEIDYNGEYREQWFKFKSEKYIEHVENQIQEYNDLEEFEMNQVNQNNEEDLQNSSSAN